MTCADRNHTLHIYATDIIYIRVDLHGTFFVLELIYMDIEIQHWDMFFKEQNIHVNFKNQIQGALLSVTVLYLS